jgi:hypothetical protein
MMSSKLIKITYILKAPVEWTSHSISAFAVCIEADLALSNLLQKLGVNLHL